MTVMIRVRYGQSKESAILERLKCKSFADAVNKFDLGSAENPWKELEALAANFVASGRFSRKLNGILVKFIGGNDRRKL